MVQLSIRLDAGVVAPAYKRHRPEKTLFYQFVLAPNNVAWNKYDFTICAFTRLAFSKLARIKDA